jgi:DNA-binding Lrp family transcriptional regulator
MLFAWNFCDHRHCMIMDHKDIRALKIFEEIGEDRVPSQRELAGKLGVSLGLVNSFIKHLAGKGYLKITKLSKNRVKYILTPKGAAQKAHLTFKYIHYSFEFYKTARRKMRSLFLDLVEQGVHRVVFYGASELAEIAFLSLQETSIEMEAVVDDMKADEKFLKSVVMDPVGLVSLSFDMILITAMDSREDIRKRILEKGIPPDKVFMME